MLDFASPQGVRQSSGEVDTRDMAVAEATWSPTTWAYVRASAAQAFDRTLGARAYEWSQEQWADMTAGAQTYKTEEEHKASPDYRPGIAFAPGTSVAWAKIEAENYDARRRREQIIQAGDANGPWWLAPLGFGAGIVGSLPDPVNLIPFGGPSIKGAQLAGMTGKQVLQNSLRQGLIEGAAGNLASSAIAAWDLNKKGENITANEVMLDTLFGAVAGPLFHGAGAFAARAATRRGMRAEVAQLSAMLPEGSQTHTNLAERLAAMQRGEATAYAKDSPLVDAMRGEGVARYLRENTNPADRMELARAMELALDDMAHGRPVDVAAVLAESSALGRAWDAVRAEIDARTPAGEPGEVLVVLEPQGQDPLGMQRGPMAVTESGEVKVKGAELARQTGSKAGYGLTKIMIKHPDITRADVMSIPRIMREYAPVADAQHGLGRTWITARADGRHMVIGEAVTPDGGMVSTVHLVDEGVKRELSQKRTPRSSTFQQFSAVEKDTGGGFLPGRSRSSEGSAVSIVREGEAVNTADGTGLDFRTETPQRTTPLPEHAALHEAERALTPDPAKPSPEELQVRQLLADGRLGDEDIKALAELEDERAHIETIEDASFQVLECVMGIME